MPELSGESPQSMAQNSQLDRFLSPDSPTLQLALDVLNRVITTRTIAGFRIRTIDKTGSSLHLLENETNSTIVRNGEIPESAATVWEFLEVYAHTIFTKDVVKKLFGVWGKAQVAPIIEQRGKRKIYRKDGDAVVYSKIVGFTTEQLAREWQLEDLVDTYAPTINRQYRWRGSLSYFMITDLVRSNPSLGDNGELLRLLELFWQEFSNLNGVQIASQNNPLENDLSDSVDFDDKGRATLRLVELSHQVGDCLRQTIMEMKDGQHTPLLWSGKPIEKVLLYLLHLQQALEQQMMQWWLGIAHGHLHSSNVVSRFSTRENREKSPLETFSIDFDRAAISTAMLSHADELYEMVDAQAVYKTILDTSVHSSARLQLLVYLPLAQWDTNIFEFLNQYEGHPFIRSIRTLICIRLEKDVQDTILLKAFTDWLHMTEMNEQMPQSHKTSLLNGT